MFSKQDSMKSKRFCIYLKHCSLSALFKATGC